MTETRARVLGPRDGEILALPDAVTDRFMISGADAGGLEGRVGALLGDEEVFGEVGDLIFKPRDQWHTYWNAGDTPARILEIISPGGFEEAFREIDTLEGEPDPSQIAAIAARYGCDVDFERTMPIVERHGLAF